MFYHSNWETEDWSNWFNTNTKFESSKPSKETDLFGFTYINKPNDFKEEDNNDK